jgi:hypothetical protein
MLRVISDDFARRDVAEHAAGEDQVSRDGTLVRIRHRGVCGDDFHSVEPSVLGGAAREDRVVLVKLDQASRNIRAQWMLSQHSDQVVPLSRAHADRPHRTGGAPIQCGAHLPLHDHQASAQR